MDRLLPTPARDLDDDALLAHYEVPDEPHVRLNFVASVDGAVAVQGRSAGLQTPGDNRVFGLLRDLADAILVAGGTVRAEQYGPSRPSRRRRERRTALGRPEAPGVIVVSGSLDLDPTWELFTAPDVRTTVLTCANAPADRKERLGWVADVIEAGEESVDLAAGLAELASRGPRRLICEGGPSLFSSLVAAGLADELCLTISPLLAGAGAGRITGGPVLPAPARLALVGLLEEDGALFGRWRIESES